jgi:hypothetical protein
MKNQSQLTKDFAAAVASARNPPPTSSLTPLEERARKSFTVTSRKKFLKEVDKRLKMFAKAMPQAIGRDGLEDLVPLPAKIHFNKGALKVWRGRREAFSVSYKDLRNLDGMKQILKMSEKADVGIDITLSNISAVWPDRSLHNCNEPTAQERMPWTMKRDAGHFSEFYITVKPAEKFAADNFPKKLAPNSPKPPSPPVSAG